MLAYLILDDMKARTMFSARAVGWGERQVSKREHSFQRENGPAGAMTGQVSAEFRQEPAVPVGDSVQPGYLICLETGTRQILLARHLWESFRMTPQDYREKWELGPDYPMRAPVYDRWKAAAQRVETKIADSCIMENDKYSSDGATGCA